MKDNPRFEIEATTNYTGETKHFDSYEDFIQIARFFWSSGRRYEDIENKAESIMEYLGTLGDHGMAMEFITSGLTIKIIYLKCAENDRHMKYVKKAS